MVLGQSKEAQARTVQGRREELRRSPDAKRAGLLVVLTVLI
jgi:hypothetical protein